MELLTCSKCEKRLNFDGSNVCCVCVDCRRSFCLEEGRILNGELALKLIKETYKDRIITDFLCYDCEAQSKGLDIRNRQLSNSELRKELARKQDGELAKRETEKEQSEILAKQMLHASDSLEFNDEERNGLPKYRKATNVKHGYWGETKPCSTFIERYGSQWATDTDIYLELTDHELTRQYCLQCAMRIVQDWKAICDSDHSSRASRATPTQ